MGAGAGAAAPVDHDISPRLAAIEKAQAELRLEVAVREERRRELEFLEKGGNPLDFQVGEIINPSRSSTDPLADQLLPIGTKSSSVENCLQSGEVSLPSSCEAAVTYAGEPGQKECRWSLSKAPPCESSSLQWNAKGGSPSNGPRSEAETEIELGPVKVREAAGGGWTSTSQSYMRRNRPRLKLEGPSDVVTEVESEDGAGKNGSQGMSTRPVSSADAVLQKSVLVDDTSQLQLTSSVDANCGLTDSHIIDTQRCSPMNASLSCNQVDEPLALTDENRGWEHQPESTPLDNREDNGQTHVAPPLEVVAGADSNESTKFLSEGNVPVASGHDAPCGYVTVGSSVCSIVDENGCCTVGRVQRELCKAEAAPPALEVLDLDEKGLQNVAPGTVVVANAADDTVPDKQVLQPKLENYVSCNSDVPDFERDGFRLQEDNCSQSVAISANEFKFREQPAIISGALVGLSRSTVRAANVATRFPGVVLPWEKEKDPVMIAEAEKRKATISAAAKKAQEDCILEEAETIMASRSQVAKLDRRKPIHEPVRRTSHWDYVLQEMTWMANDFMQERSWKTASAAQLAKCAAMAHPGFTAAEKDLIKMQRLVAHTLSDAVVRFWQTVSDCLKKSNYDIKAGETGNLSDGSVPMEVDMPVEEEELGGRRDVLIRKYCIRRLEDSTATQAEAPSTPECTLEQPLTYTRSEGAFEMYQASVAMLWAPVEADHEQVRHELHAIAEAGVDAQAVGEDFATSDLTPEAGGLMHVSSPRRASSDEEVHSHSMPGDLVGLGAASIIAKKKRKKIQKSMPTKVSESISGASLEQTSGKAAHSDYSFGSSVATGKRLSPGGAPSSTVSVGTIPIKRLRTSAVAARQRAAGISGTGFSVGSGGLLSRARLATGSNHALHQQGLLAAPPTVQGNTPISTGTGQKVVQSARNNLFLSKSKKRKKAKHLSGAICKGAGDGGAVGNVNSSVKREHLKRKGDHALSLSPSVRSSEPSIEGFDTPSTPGGVNKKLKIVKQTPDSSTVSASGGFTAPQAAPQLSTASCKLVRQSCSRDRSNRKAKPGKVTSSQPGSGIPWSVGEDQTILHVVQSLGTNWELVSDVLQFNSQLKGIFRKPKHCRERHKCLVEHASGEGGESPEDLSVQQQLSAGQGASKGLLEDIGKPHFEQIVHLVEKHRLYKAQNATQGQKQFVQIHPSHASIMAQYCGITGIPSTPLELCDDGDMTAQQFQMQPQHGITLGLPNVVSGGVSSRPGSAGMPGLPGLQLSPPVTPSSVTIHSSVARDGQRHAPLRPIVQDESNQMRYTRAPLHRGLPQPGPSVATGLAMIGQSDCIAPGLPASGASGMISGLKRGMSLPRPGLPNLGPGLNSSGLGGMLPPGGVGMSTGMSPGAVSGQMSLARRPRDSAQPRSSRSSEEQRQILLQELQHHAVQGNPQAAAALSNFNNSLSTALMSPPPQNFAQQQQLPSPHAPGMQHQQQQSQLPHSQQQTPYFVQAAQERQLQQQQRMLHQQQIRQNSSIQLPQSSSSVAQHQHLQGHMHPQQSHILTLQQQVGSQQMSIPQQQLFPPSSMSTSSLQHPSPPHLSLPSQVAASPASHSGQQQVQQAASADQMSHLLLGKVQSPKQAQKSQQALLQAQSRAVKSSSRGASMVQGLTTSQAASPSGLSGHVTMPAQVPSQQLPQIQGQRSLQVQTPIQLGKQASQQAPVGQSTGKSPLQGQSQGLCQRQVPAQVVTPAALQKQQQQPPTQHQVSATTTNKQQGAGKVQAAVGPLASVAPPVKRAAGQPAQPSPSSTPAATAGPSPQMLPPPQPSPALGTQPQSNAALVQTTGPPQSQQAQLQNAQRRLPQHQQATYRRLPLRQPATSVVQPPPGPLPSQPMHAPGVMNPCVPLSSSFGSSGPGMQSVQWKPNQPLSPVSSSLYQSKRCSSSGTATNTSPVQSANANLGASLSSPTLLSHGSGTGGVASQQLSSGQGGAGHGPSLVVAGAGNARGGQPVGQRAESVSVDAHGGTLAVKSLGSGSVRSTYSPAPAVPGAPLVPTVGGGASSGASTFQGNPSSGSAPTSSSMRYGVQTRTPLSHFPTTGGVLQKPGVSMTSAALNTACMSAAGAVGPPTMGSQDPAVDQ